MAVGFLTLWSGYPQALVSQRVTGSPITATWLLLRRPANSDVPRPRAGRSHPRPFYQSTVIATWPIVLKSFSAMRSAVWKRKSSRGELIETTCQNERGRQLRRPRAVI
jgi:hypothetical protein